jgi:hypothetical protein
VPARFSSNSALTRTRAQERQCVMLRMIEVVLGRWFVRRTVYETQIEQLVEQNRILLLLVENAHDASAAVLKELRRRDAISRPNAISLPTTLH